MAMKLLAFLFLVGFALAAAVPLPSNELEVGDAAELEYMLFSLEAEGDDDDDPKTELGKKLREHLDEILAKIKDAIENGKTVKSDYMEKMKQIREKLKEMKEDIGKKARNLMDKIRESGKDYFKKLLENLGLSKRDIEMRTEEFFMQAEGDETVNNIREEYEKVLEKIKDFIANKRGSLKEILEKLRELRQKLREKGIDLGEKGKEVLQKIRDKVKEYFDKLLEKLGKGKRAFNFREMLKKLRDKVAPLIDPDMIKGKIEEIFGKGNEYAEMLIKKLKGKNEKAKQWLLDYIDKFFEGEENQEYRRSIKEVYEKVKDYLKKVKIELKEKFSKFGEWAVEQYEKGLEKGKSKAENLRNLARKFIDEAKDASRDVIDQAKEFFQEYKDDLGTVYDDVVAKIKEILHKNKMD